MHLNLTLEFAIRTHHMTNISSFIGAVWFHRVPRFHLGTGTYRSGTRYLRRTTLGINEVQVRYKIVGLMMMMMAIPPPWGGGTGKCPNMPIPRVLSG